MTSLFCYKTSQYSTVYPYACKLPPLGTETLGARSILLPHSQLQGGVDGGVESRQLKWSRCLIPCRAVVARIALCSLGEQQVIWYLALQKRTHLYGWNLNLRVWSLLLQTFYLVAGLLAGWQIPASLLYFCHGPWFSVLSDRAHPLMALCF